MSVLTNKIYKDYSYTSRYNEFPCYYHNIDKRYVSGITAYLSDETTYTLHVVKPGETFDSLALEYYNNPTMYWVICSFNHIADPYEKLVSGQKIRIPVLSNIKYDMDGWR